MSKVKVIRRQNAAIRQQALKQQAIDGAGATTETDGPLVRLVVPTKNRSAMLRECLDSLLAQTLTRWVCCVVDDGSDDDTAAAMQGYLSDPRILFVRNPTSVGTGEALNVGFAYLPRTPYETWFADDNRMYPNMLEVLAAALDENPSIVKAYGDYDVAFEEDGRVTAVQRGTSLLNMEWVPGKLNKEYYLGCGWLWRTEVREACGKFVSRPCEDYDMALRLARLGEFLFVPQRVAWYRSHRDNLTNRLRRERRQPKVRLVVPTRNRAEMLREALLSIQAQTFQEWACCVVDDASDDSTRSVVEPFMADRRFKYLRNDTQLGTGASLNRGFAALPAAEFETWWADDNKMEPGMLTALFGALTAHPEKVLSYSDYIHENVDDKGSILSRYRATEHMDMAYSKQKLRTFCCVGMCWLWRTEARKECGEFSTELCEDYDMMLRLAEAGDFIFIPDVLGTYVAHPKNLSARIDKGEGARWWERRHSEAAHRGRNKKPLRVLQIHFEFDCAGVGWRLKQAFQKHSTIQVTHAAGAPVPWCHETDCRIWDRRGDFLRLIAEADVLHFNEWGWDYRHGSSFLESMSPQNKPTFDLSPYLKDKRVVLHLHGGPMQCWPDHLVEMCASVGGTLVVCDPLTEGDIPGSVWMPNLLNTEEIGSPASRKYDGAIGVHMAYAGAGVEAAKGVPKVRETVDYLRHRGVPLKWQQCYGVPWATAIEKRKPDHICVDNLTQGFIGMAGWEALAMGQVVVARLDPLVQRRYTDFCFGDNLPIRHVNGVNQLGSAIRELADAREHLRERCAWSRWWVDRYYDPLRIVQMWEDLYQGKPAGVAGLEQPHASK